MIELERKIVTLPNNDVRYCVLGPKMAVDFHFSDVGGIGVIAGLETHYQERPSYMRERDADFTECWLTDAPCWCDGTSLYATEHLYPLFKSLGVDGFWTVLETEWRSRYLDAFAEAK